MRNYKSQLVLAEFPKLMRGLGVPVMETDGTYDSTRGILLMLAEENKHHREAIDKLQIEVDQLRRRLIIIATGEMPDEQA